MNALEQSRINLAEAKKQAALIEDLQNQIPFEINSLFGNRTTVWATLNEMSLSEAIKAIESLNPVPIGKFTNGGTAIIQPISTEARGGEILKFSLPYGLKIKSSDFRGESESFELYGFISVKNNIVKIIIPLTLKTERVCKFERSGSTSRSKIVRTVFKHKYIEPFNSGFIWGGGGVSDMEMFQIDKGN